MDLHGWNERYRQREMPGPPTPALVKAAQTLQPGNALDLACGSGRNALWLAANGWKTTAIDGAAAAIETLQLRAAGRGLVIDTHVADLEKGEYRIQPEHWDFIAICYYLQRDLFEPAKLGLKPGGILLAIVHITEPDENPTNHRLRPGELAQYFKGWKILHSAEGRPDDPEHQHKVAEIVAQKPASAGA